MSTDRLLAVLALVALIAFLAVIVIFVPEADLTAVLLITVALGAVDFWRYAGRRNGGAS